MPRTNLSIHVRGRLTGVDRVIGGRSRRPVVELSVHDEERRVAELHRRRPRQPLFAARSDQRAELQRSRGRLALQDRQPRHAARVQARRDAADGQGRAVHDRRHAPRRRGARRGHRRAALGPPLPRRPARRRRAPSAFRPRPRVLDRRQGRRSHPLRHAGLSPHRARREDRAARPRRSARTASST